MSTTFTMPALGADMTAGILARWHRGVGDEVSRGDVIAAVETDKGVIDVQVFADGVIEALLVDEGHEVPVGTPLATIAAVTEAAVRAAATAEPATGEAALPEQVLAEAQPTVSPTARRVADAAGIDLATVAGTGPERRVVRRDVERVLERRDGRTPAPASPTQPRAANGPVPAGRATPAALELALALGLDLSLVGGTGPGGRVMRRDVEAAGAALAAAAERTPAPPPAPPAGDAPSRMRQAIAAAMGRSNREIPHYYLTETIDLERALAWLADENERRPVPKRVLPATLLVKAVALALRTVPELNATWHDDRAVPSEHVHVGVAISLRDGGLVAPAIHDADQRSLDELMASFRDLVARARRGGLRAAELSDPTITVTNLGETGVESVLGVIFPPQVAIVGFGRIVERPWVVDGRIVPRRLVHASLAGDHRVTDGHHGAALLGAVDRLLQEPEAL